MALKPRTKKTPLAFMGEGWEESYIESRIMSVGDQDALDAFQKDKTLKPEQQGAAIVKLFFVSGKGLGESGDLVDITPEDIDAMDIFTIGELASQVGLPDPKASESSTPTSEVSDQLPEDSPNLPIENDLD